MISDAKKNTQGTKPFAICVVILCTIFTSLGSLFLKKGADALSFSMQGLLDGWFLILGLFFYFLGFVLLTFAFKHGQLSVLYPFVSLSFIWTTILSYLFLQEYIGVFHILGNLSIVLGVIFIGSSNIVKDHKIKLRG